jgi:hypothetical protein
VDGKIDLVSDKAKAAIGYTLFHQNAFHIRTPTLNENIVKTLSELKDPKASEIIDNVKAPTDERAKTLTRTALGLKPNDPG